MSETSLSAIRAVLGQKKQEVIAKAEHAAAVTMGKRLSEDFDGQALKKIARLSPSAEEGAFAVLAAIAANPMKSKMTLIQKAAADHKTTAARIQTVFDAMGISFDDKEVTVAEELDESNYKEIHVGSTVTPNKGPHKGVPHEVIHVHDDGEHANVKPIGMMPKNVKYHLGAAKVNLLNDLQEGVEHADKLSEEITNVKTDNDGTRRHYNEAGQLHREGGPAIEHANGSKAWYKNGERVHKAEHADRIKSQFNTVHQEFANAHKKLGEDIDTLAEDMSEDELAEFTDQVAKMDDAIKAAKEKREAAKQKELAGTPAANDSKKESLDEDWVPMAKVKPGQVEKVKTRKSGNNYFYVVSTDVKAKTFEVVTPKAYNDGETDKTVTVAFGDVVMASTDSFAEDGEKGGKKETGYLYHKSKIAPGKNTEDDEDDKKSKRKSANKAVSNMDGDESEELDESGRPVVTHKVGDKVHV